MGATFVSKTLDGKLKPSEVQEKFAQIQEQDRYESGHDAYNGTLSTCTGIIIVDRTFDSVEEAENWLSDNTEKWREAKAVKAKDVHTVTTGKPTFPTKKVKGVYGFHDEILSSELRQILSVRNDPQYNIKDLICESYHSAQSFRYRWQEGKRWECVPANELSDEDKRECARLFDAYYDALVGYNKAMRGIKERVEVLQTKLLLPFDDYEGLKKLREQAQTGCKAVMTAQEALLKFDKEKGTALIQTKNEDRGVVWVIGGIAAM